jgi:hypothetical protein
MTEQERKRLVRRLTSEYVKSLDFAELFGGKVKMTLMVMNLMAAAQQERVRQYGRRLAAMSDAELRAHAEEKEDDQ